MKYSRYDDVDEEATHFDREECRRATPREYAVPSRRGMSFGAKLAIGIALGLAGGVALGTYLGTRDKAPEKDAAARVESHADSDASATAINR